MNHWHAKCLNLPECIACPPQHPGGFKSTPRHGWRADEPNSNAWDSKNEKERNRPRARCPGPLSGSALAAPIFSDDFNRSNANNVGGGWSEIERNGNDVMISGNALQLRDIDQQSTGSASLPDAAATFTVSTLGLENLFLSFAWAPLMESLFGMSWLTTEASDSLNVSWRSGSGAWTDIWSAALDRNTLSTENLAMGAAAAIKAALTSASGQTWAVRSFLTTLQTKAHGSTGSA
ncbi:hypothetical protein [Thauera humireducens]|uniref:hypothetical protein n=1 Tax=Thauera humireducens TaxID=1134435 RepID=UPI00311EE765